MKKFNSPYTALITLLAFLCLATYSWGETDHGYSQRDIDAVNRLAMGEESERKADNAGLTASSPTNAAKMVYLYDEQGGKP
jgi:hypothetical protein